jgi:hypothetical protein
MGAEPMGAELEGEGSDGPWPGDRVFKKPRIASSRWWSDISPASAKKRRFSAALSASPVLIISNASRFRAAVLKLTT